jgi:hypothetical protein
MIVSVSPAHAADPFAWTPPDHPAIVRGREVGNRFDLLSAWEVTLPVDNAFSAENRRALAALEKRLGLLPGVRKVVGPSALLDVSVSDRRGGAITASLALARGGAGAGPAAESDNEAVRQRIVRRADALGWFLSTDGRVARVLVYTDDIDRVRRDVEAAVGAAGVKLSYAGVPIRVAPLWADPRDVRASWLALGGRRVLRRAGHLSGRRAALVVLAAAGAAASPFALSGVSGLRLTALLAAAGAAAGAVLLVLLTRSPGTAAAAFGRPAAPPRAALVLAVVVVAAAGTVLGRLHVGTQQWRASPVMFISARGDLEQPVVLREVRRLTDFLRAEPGVANAWSVADFFFGVARDGDEPGRIPDRPDEIRRLLVGARQDAALRLQLAGDLNEALIAVRFDREAEVDRLQLLDRLSSYLRTELRAALVQVDLGRGGLSPVTRAAAKGILAADARERILRICARSGRNLNDAAVTAIERAARQAAVFPAVDLGRLRADVAQEVRVFVSTQNHPLPQAERERLTVELAAQGEGATKEEVRAILTNVYGATSAPATTDAVGEALAARLVSARHRAAALFNDREMLSGADLPTEGMLADEVRSATREAMGPIVGIPVALNNPGAFRLDVQPLGGAANDRVLSDQWAATLRVGVLAGVLLLALVLILVGGARGVLWLPLALALPAMAIFVPALTRDPVGVIFLSFWAGAMAAGAAMATSFAARRA